MIAAKGSAEGEGAVWTFVRRRVGSVAVVAQLASDGRWWWDTSKGDRMTDLVAVRLVKRSNHPAHVVNVVVGPFSVMLGWLGGP